MHILPRSKVNAQKLPAAAATPPPHTHTHALPLGSLPWCEDRSTLLCGFHHVLPFSPAMHKTAYAYTHSQHTCQGSAGLGCTRSLLGTFGPQHSTNGHTSRMRDYSLLLMGCSPAYCNKIPQKKHHIIDVSVSQTIYSQLPNSRGVTMTECKVRSVTVSSTTLRSTMSCASYFSLSTSVKPSAVL